ncbi:MAG: hypothetical protein KJZ78_12820 [Bryobacteraceae bacterium]|nr:hypothetical protein [Bryobacteraceae bacterium]
MVAVATMWPHNFEDSVRQTVASFVVLCSILLLAGLGGASVNLCQGKHPAILTIFVYFAWASIFIYLNFVGWGPLALRLSIAERMPSAGNPMGWLQYAIPATLLAIYGIPLVLISQGGLLRTNSYVTSSNALRAVSIFCFAGVGYSFFAARQPLSPVAEETLGVVFVLALATAFGTASVGAALGDRRSGWLLLGEVFSIVITQLVLG